MGVVKAPLCNYLFIPALAYGTLAFWSVRDMGALETGASTTKPIPETPHALTDHLALAFSPLRLRHAPFGALSTQGGKRGQRSEARLLSRGLA
jgi:hypothetical protein